MNMTDWVEQISEGMDAVHAQWDTFKSHVKKTLGIQDPILVMPYLGYGTPHKLHLKGRVLEDEGIKLQEEHAPVWENLVNMYRRFETDELPAVPLRIWIEDQSPITVMTDDEGFFDAEIALVQPLTGDRLWHPIQVELLLEEERVVSHFSQAEAIVVTAQAEFGVISDIDDTIVHTAATDLLKMITIAYLGNERTRRPFDGVAAFYQALQQGRSGQAGNPIFYVSSSAWNMYDLFIKFLEFNDVPKGPIFLRDIELSLANLLYFDHEAHKREYIKPILERFPHLPFLLIGDTGQQDAEIYYQLVQEYPEQIKAIYLRNVTPHNRDRLHQLTVMGEVLKERGVEFLVFDDTAEAAEHAARHDWMLPSLVEV